MTPDSDQDGVNPGNPPPAPAPVLPPGIFSDAEAEAALAQLKAIAAAEEAAAAAPPPPAAPEAVEMSAEELYDNPEEARRRFDAAVADLREAFAAWVVAKQAQFEQLLDIAWSGQHDMPSFLKQLEQERERLSGDAYQTESDVDSTTGAMEAEDEFQRLEDMKFVWAKLRAEGVPRNQWPLDAGLPFGLQFQVQAELERDLEKPKP